MTEGANLREGEATLRSAVQRAKEGDAIRVTQTVQGRGSRPNVNRTRIFVEVPASDAQQAEAASEQRAVGGTAGFTARSPRSTEAFVREATTRERIAGGQAASDAIRQGRTSEAAQIATRVDRNAVAIQSEADRRGRNTSRETSYIELTTVGDSVTGIRPVSAETYRMYADRADGVVRAPQAGEPRFQIATVGYDPSGNRALDQRLSFKPSDGRGSDRLATPATVRGLRDVIRRLNTDPDDAEYSITTSDTGPRILVRVPETSDRGAFLLTTLPPADESGVPVFRILDVRTNNDAPQQTAYFRRRGLQVDEGTLSGEGSQSALRILAATFRLAQESRDPSTFQSGGVTRTVTVEGPAIGAVDRNGQQIDTNRAKVTYQQGQLTRVELLAPESSASE